MSDIIVNIFVLANIVLYITGWIAVVADYIMSGNMQRRRLLRQKLKDPLLSQMERDYMKPLLSLPWILIL